MVFPEKRRPWRWISSSSSSTSPWSKWTNPSESIERQDGLYHAYNLIKLDQRQGIPIRRLYEMLEGQVAVLSSGRLSPQESLNLLLALRASAMYRPDQESYLLYPNLGAAQFLERNRILITQIASSKLLQALGVQG